MAASLSVAVPASAVPGALDLSFGGDGKVATDGPAFNADYGEDVVVQADDKIVAVGWREDEDIGWTYTLVARYLPDGTPDPDFGGGDGLVTLPLGHPSAGFAVDLLSDQRIVIASYAPSGPDLAFAASLLTTTGELDPSFDGDGVAIADLSSEDDIAYGLDVDASDRIVLVGIEWTVPRRLGLARFTSAGVLDTTFSGDGKRSVADGNAAWGRDVEVRPNGKIVAVGAGGNGTRFLVTRFLNDGTLDTTFSGDGVAMTSKGFEASALAFQTDGKVVVVGRGLGADLVVARFRLGGSLDPTFSVDGVARTDFDGDEDFGRDVEVQSNGKIIAVGYASVSGLGGRYAIVRYRSDGRRDSTFSGDGRITQPGGVGEGSALDGSGRLLVTGTSGGGMQTVRYLLS